MGVNSSRVAAQFDADAAVTLRNINDGAETSSATETPVSLDELDLAYWQTDKEIPHGVICVAIHITACDAANADETYTISLQVDDTSNHSDTPVTVWSQAIARGFTGVLYAYVDSRNIPLLDTDSSGTDKWIAIRAALGGTTPSITYGAWMWKGRFN